MIALLEDSYRNSLSGALRFTTSTSTGTIWLVRGQAVHANCVTPEEVYEGMRAFELLVTWLHGSYHIDEDVLPPGRTIRLPMADLILAAKQSIRRALISDMQAYAPRTINQRLDSIIEVLRKRVPGIESISVINRDQLEASTSEEKSEREWIGKQIRQFTEQSQSRPETLYLKVQGRALLMIGDEQESTVLSATEDTTPEAMFWAGQEALRRIRLQDEEKVKE
ncbi:DUF4388 domain-containing protein [bacterium]|nr:DUF4388 domain-containing protein [bacterium]MBU1637618.1 DUF4388 domain-containing protein [bacterium]